MLSARITSFLKENGWLLNLLFIALGAYFVAGAANAVVARSIRMVPTVDTVPIESSSRLSSQPVEENADRLTAIAERNLMAAQRENLQPITVPSPDSAQIQPGDFRKADLKPCTMSHQLRATLVAEGYPEWSMAVVVNNTTHEPEVFSINPGTNRIVDDAILVDIRDRAVVVHRRDHFEICYGEGDTGTGGSSSVASVVSPPTESTEGEGGGGPGVTMISETEYKVERGEVDNALANLSQVATEVRVVPNFKNGKPNGFKLFSIKQPSIFSKIGLKNGDIIQKINGYEMNSPDKALELYQKLKDASSVSIELQRRGQTKTFNYGITQ